jgi:hypothetical protein
LLVVLAHIRRSARELRVSDGGDHPLNSLNSLNSLNPLNPLCAHRPRRLLSTGEGVIDRHRELRERAGLKRGRSL